MARKDDEFEMSSTREKSGSARREVQCAACSRTVGFSKTHPFCPLCGAKLEFSTPNYSGRPEDIVTGRERFPAQRRTTFVERRRCNRIPCRDARACIRPAGSTSVIVEMPNISRNGMCFRTSEQFRPEARVSIATHYTQGGQNIFQDGRIIWMRDMESGISEYGVEFTRARFS
jgi:PilZ domain-containing protein